MNYATDRDLLVYEPSLFLDLPWSSQTRLHVTDATIAGTTLTSAAADFELAQVEPCSVVLAAEVALEVLARADANTLTVSRLRARLPDAAIPPQPGTDLDLIVRTFAPQTALVHDALLAMLGLDDDEPIVSLSVMARLETLGTLERLYASAVALTGDTATLLHKADHYRRRFRHALERSTVLLDLDGDGTADTRLPLGTVQLQRA